MEARDFQLSRRFFKFKTIMFILMLTVWFLTYINGKKHDFKETYYNNSMFLLNKLQSSLKIIEGQKVNEGEYPYVVLIAFQDGNELVRVCTACMLAAEWVLTAGHCVKKIPKYITLNELYIWYGNFTVPTLKMKLRSHVLSAFVHPSYQLSESPYFNLLNDISLLRVDRIHMSRYGRLLAADHTSLIGLPVTFLGGGLTNLAGPVNQLAPLEAGEGVIVVCDTKIKMTTKYIMCVAPKCSNRLTAPYGGDSGSPLIHDGYILGVYSFGSTKEKYVDIAYTPISPYMDWIYNVMHPKHRTKE